VYSENDGILSNEFNPPAIRTKDGLLLFGTVKGVTAFYPDSINAVSYSPPLVFTDLKVNNSSIRPGQVVLNKVLLDKAINRVTTLNFSYRIREFTIEFASLEYSSPEKIKYRYKIDEFGDDWIDIGNKDFISFTGLMPGTYHLHITGTNSDGIWSDKAKPLKIVIQPPWWKTRLFILLAIIVAAALTVGFIRYRIWRLKRDKASLEKLVSMRTLEVEKQNREIKAQHEEIKSQKEYIEEQNVLLEKHRDRLEDLVEERTRELTQAKEKAEESNRLKTAFLQNLSHEIRTPLNAIMGFSELLHRQEYHDEEKDGFTDIIINSSRQLLSIMNNILTISSLETGQEKTDKKVVIISDIIDELVPVFRPVAINKGLIFNVKHPENENLIKTMLLITDEHMLQQVLHHIINNAFKFTQKGSIEVGYTINDDCVRFHIKDTGIGIHPEFIGKIFDRFRKGETYKSIEDWGTGLGLSIAKAYVELLGGKIWVESAPGKGSTFYFTIQII
jgi:signal transduction histidine kinase